MFFLKSRQPRSIERKVCVESAVELLDLCGGKQGKQYGGKSERATSQYEQVPPVGNAAVILKWKLLSFSQTNLASELLFPLVQLIRSQVRYLT